MMASLKYYIAKTSTLCAALVFLNTPIAHAKTECHSDKSMTVEITAKNNSNLALAQSMSIHVKNRGLDPAVIDGMYKASLKTGVDFKLLLLKAKIESDLGRAIEAKHSTARGVFQYIEPTWLILMKRYGADIGYPHYAKAIDTSLKGNIPHIKGNNRFLRAEILALRYDPEVSALIKTKQIHEETRMLEHYKGQKATITDHYISHMLGLPLSKTLYKMRKSGSGTAIAYMKNPAMREAAKLNRPFFFRGKKPLGARDVYKKFQNKVAYELKALEQTSRKINNEISLQRETCALIRTVTRTRAPTRISI